MPLYVFACDSCGTRSEVQRPMAEAGKRFRCQCGKNARRDYKSEQFSAHAWQEYDSTAIACFPWEARKGVEDGKGNVWLNVDDQGKTRSQPKLLCPAQYRKNWDRSTGKFRINSRKEYQQMLRDSGMFPNR